MIGRIFNAVLICLMFAAVLHAQQSRVSNRNSSLTVNAGPSQIVTLPASATLAGSVIVLPKRASASITWTGPAGVTFANPNAASTSAAFSSAGTYVLTLTATSSTKLTTHSNVTITVNPAVIPPPPPPPPPPPTGPNNLAWNAVIATETAPVDGYNLYRTDGACDDPATFQKINSQVITGTTYSDSAPQPVNYCYLVRAVNTTGVSPESNIIWVPAK